MTVDTFSLLSNVLPNGKRIFLAIVDTHPGNGIDSGKFELGFTDIPRFGKKFSESRQNLELLAALKELLPHFEVVSAEIEEVQ